MGLFDSAQIADLVGIFIFRYPRLVFKFQITAEFIEMKD